MAVWVIRGGRGGEHETAFIERNAVAIGFGFAQSIGDFATKEALGAHLSPSAKGQLWRFCHEIQRNDMVVLPRKITREVAVGSIVGDYTFQPNCVGDAVPHTRAVEWLATDIPRADFDRDLLNSLGALATVSQPRAPDAERRIGRIAKRYLGDPIDETPGDEEAPEVDPSDEADLNEAIEDRIVERLRRKFAGERLEHLVACILRASGYMALQTRRGSDGGVDIVAGRGDLGFAEPRLCVQVKARSGKVDLAEYDRLMGNVKNFGAKHGLLVSLGGFTKAVLDRNAQSFFEVRLWGPYELAERLLETYDSLPSDIHADIPLRDLKVLEDEDVP